MAICLLRLFQLKVPLLNLHVILDKDLKFLIKIKYNNNKFNSDSSKSSKRSKGLWSLKRNRKRTN